MPLPTNQNHAAKNLCMTSVSVKISLWQVSYLSLIMSFFQKKKTFLHRTSIKDGCNNCKCNNGIVACAYTSITIGCLYLQNKETTTVPPNGCKFEGQYR